MRFRQRRRHGEQSNTLLYVGGVLSAIMVLMAAIGPYLSRYGIATATSDAYAPPSSSHWFGTDGAGLDVFSRVVGAARVDITIGLAVALFSFIIGASVGLILGYFHGRLSSALMRGLDMVQSLPLFVISIVVVVASGRNIWNIVLVATLWNVPIFARLVRSRVLTVREQSFVEASRVAGNSEVRTAVRYVFPVSISPAVAQVPVSIGFALLITAGLSFIGAGVRPPNAEWGLMISSGINDVVSGQWWTSVFPGVAISIAVFGFAALGEGARRLVER